MNKLLLEKKVTKGYTVKRLFDTAKFYNLLLEHGVLFSEDTLDSLALGIYDQNSLIHDAVKYGIPQMEVFELLETCVKPIFRWNLLGKLIYKSFGKDVQINFITGVWTTKPVVDNLVTTVGKGIISGQLNGVTTAPVTAIAIGTGTNAAAAGDTALQTEITDSGGERGAATTSRQTTTTTNDTAQWVKTFTFTGSKAVTEEGLLDNNTSGGNLLARQVFSAINVVSADTLQVTHKVAFS